MNTAPWGAGPSPAVLEGDRDVCTVCGTTCPRLRDHMDGNSQWYITPAKCSLCCRPVCFSCKKPKHGSDRFRYQWFCAECWIETPHCDRCGIMMSDTKTNLLMCRMHDLNGVECIRLLCKTCGRNHDGCRKHGLGPAARGKEQWAGAWLEDSEWHPQVNAVLNANCLMGKAPFCRLQQMENRPATRHLW